MAKQKRAAGGESPPATLTLARNGRVVPLHMPDMYALVTTDVSIPNQALEDILALRHYGVLLSRGDDESQLARLKRLTAMQFELFRLCCGDANLVLEGDAAPGDLTPSDLTGADLDAVQTFFQTGGSRGVSTTTDTEPVQDAPVDRPGETVAETTE